MAFDLFVERDKISKEATDLYIQAQLLAANPDLTLLDVDEQKKRKARLTEQHNRAVRAAQYASYLEKQLAQLEDLGLVAPGSIDWAWLPPGSWLLKCKVALARPLLSKDDEEFHISDNPVRKDKVYKVPMLGSSSWKGALRAAATRQIANAQLDSTAFANRRLQLSCLFGTEKGVDITEEDEAKWEAYLDKVGGVEAAQKYRKLLQAIAPTGFLQGRLHFYPCYFDKMDVEVINPHDREKKAGKMPIYLESVKIGAEGTFALLYVPMGLVSNIESVIRQEVANDLELLIPALQAMFLEYGFGAKTSSGFGVVKNRLPEPGGTFSLGLKGLSVVWHKVEEPRAVVPAVRPILPPECEEFMEDSEFLMAKPKELRKRPGWTTQRVKRYKAAKKLYLDYQRRMADWEASRGTEEETVETETTASSAQAGYFSDTFESFDELDRLCEALVTELRKEVPA